MLKQKLNNYQEEVFITVKSEGSVLLPSIQSMGRFPQTALYFILT